MTNRAFEDLEKRSSAINRKRYFKIFMILLLIIAVCAVAYIEFPKIKKMIFKKDIVVHEKIISKAKPVIVKKTVKKIEVKKIIVDINKTKITKHKVSKTKTIKHEAEKTKTDRVSKYNTVFLKPTIVVPKISKPTIKKKIQIPQVSKTPKIKKTISPEKEKKKINIIVKSLESEESLLKENKTNENFETTLKLSKYYLEKSKFEKAIVWSKKANHYKPSSFKPWLIYAKAKISQNKKNEAIKAIETFLSYFDSDDARKFLLTIKGQK